MGIRLSDLPPDLRRRVLEDAGIAKAPAPVRRPKAPRPVDRLSRVCACRFEMFRPDGNYPDHCDGCGAAWPSR